MNKIRVAGELSGSPHTPYASSTSPLGRIFCVLVVAVICMMSGGNSIAFAVSQSNDQTLSTHDACAAAAPGEVRCFSEVSNASSSDPNGVSPAAGSGYGPTEFHTAYQLPCTPGGPVASVCSTPASYGPQTIAIVDAGGYSSNPAALESDLQTYNTFYGLPACTVANGCLTVVNQSGATSPLPGPISTGWAQEIALDVQTAHMICQTCKIVLVEANSATVDNMSFAQSTAATFNPIAISNSWGATSDASTYDSYFKPNGIAVIASTGDNGTLTGGQSWPADIPEVVSAAGTTLNLNPDNTWASETVWSGSGGGCSANYSAPAWQTSLSEWNTQGCSGGGRSFGDVAADANPSTGARIYFAGAWYIVGGTSLSAPLIAGMYALANGLPSSASAVQLLYEKSNATLYHDVTSGSDCTGVGQLNCTAQVGFDTPTGLGAPIGLKAFIAGPGTPINLQAAYVSQSQLNLAWSGITATAGLAQYNIYRDNALLGSTLSTSYSDSSLTANTMYNYYVKAIDNNGKYAASTSVAGDTYLLPDINRDAHVNLLDFSLLATKYGQSGGSLGRSDINKDGAVNLLDFSLLASKYGN